MKGEREPYLLAWHQLYISGMVAGTVPLCYVLVPASTPRALGLFLVEVITDGGRPKERFRVNSLQLVSPRDPKLPAGGREAVYCPREKALIARLLRTRGKGNLTSRDLADELSSSLVSPVRGRIRSANALAGGRCVVKRRAETNRGKETNAPRQSTPARRN